MIRVLYVELPAGDPDVYEKLYQLASPERRQRADRYPHCESRLRCVTADALLRSALGTGAYQAAKSADGKPYLRDHPHFHYNLSHSGRYVVLAWGSSPVGVDVQQHGSADAAAIARRFFAPEEQEYLRQNPDRFYEIWTAKESYLKYTGTGLRADLRAFSVLSPEPPLRYLHHAPDPEYSLCLCTTEAEAVFQRLTVQQLLRA